MSITIRAAISSDIPAMAAIRASEWQTPEYWIARISGYLAGYHSPPKALPARTIFVATENNLVVAFVAGHLTTRFACHAELEWITVLAEKRGQGIAGLLLEKIARWFVEQNALRICVDPDASARSLYAKFGATALNRHWMVWEDSREMLRQALEVNRKAKWSD